MHEIEAQEELVVRLVREEKDWLDFQRKPSRVDGGGRRGNADGNFFVASQLHRGSAEEQAVHRAR